MSTSRLKAVLNLQQAPGIPRGDNLSARGVDMVELALEELLGHFGLDEIINARAAATPHRLGQRGHLDAGNAFEEFAGLGRDLLAVAKMAGVVVGDLGVRGRFLRRAEVDLDEIFADVLELFRPLAGLGGVLRVVLEKAIKMLQMRSAPGGVRDDGIEGIEIELIEQAARVALGHFVLAIVRVQGTAAALVRRRDDGAAVGEENVGGIAVDVTIDQILDAAGEEGDLFRR